MWRGWVATERADEYVAYIERTGLAGSYRSVPDLGAELVRDAEMKLVLEPDGFTIVIDGTDVTAAIRAPEVSAAVSAIATNLDVRADLVALDAPSYLHLAYRPGVPLIHRVWLAGDEVR